MAYLNWNDSKIWNTFPFALPTRGGISPLWFWPLAETLMHLKKMLVAKFNTVNTNRASILKHYKFLWQPFR